MIKEIAKQINQFCPNTIALVVSNPLDILTYFFQKETLFLRNKVIGIASSLDSNRFRYILSEELNVKQSQIIDSLVLGEHGDTMVPIFSLVKIDEKKLLDIINLNQKEIISRKIRDYWKSLRSYKSRSQFGIAKTTYDVIKAIYQNNELKIPASVLLNGEFNEIDVAMGVPVIINENGISKINEIRINHFESESLKFSAQTIRNYIKSI